MANTTETTSLVSSIEKGYGAATEELKKSDSSHQEASKTIGYLGSIAIAVNSLAGPAILQLPNQYQQSGLIPTTLCLIAVSVLSSFCSLHMANVVSQVPGNSKFGKCIEFSDPFHYFWNTTIYKVTQVLFFLTTVCLNVAAIVDTAEVVDSILGFHIKTVGYNPAENSIKVWQHDPCTHSEVKLGLCDPFSDQTIYGSYLLTLGYIVTAAVFLPVCLMDLKENTGWQILGFVILITSSIYFCFEFTTFNLSLTHASLWGHEYGDMLGVILFNFALVLAVPAWLHEKKDDVSVNKVVVGSTVIATSLYIFVGALGACSISHVNVNMLAPMVSGAYGEGIQIAGSVFAFFIIGLDIPLFCVLTRYNLTHSGLCTERWANVLVVWIPWMTSWMFYQGDAIKELLDWGGVLLTSVVAFLLPLYLALLVLKTTDRVGSIHVYGRHVSRQKQIKSLYFLLLVAVVAVIAAIGGQVMHTNPGLSTETIQKQHHRSSHHLHHGHLNFGTEPGNMDTTDLLMDTFDPAPMDDSNNDTDPNMISINDTDPN
jgi:amino acid permease